MEAAELIDVTTLSVGDEVHYYCPYTESGFEIGTVREQNSYTEGVTVHGDGWNQYVGKWFIFKVIRRDRVIFNSLPRTVQ